jgi:hypothetical protein
LQEAFRPRAIASDDQSEGETVLMAQDKLAMRNGVQQVISRFNTLLDTANANGADRTTRLLIRDLQGAARTSRRALEAVGLRFASDGKLAIDEKRLNEAMENGSLERFFTGGEGGQPNNFVGRLGRISDSLLRNPMRHVSPHASRLPGFNAAMDAINNQVNNRGQSAAASRFDAYLPDDVMSFLFDALR